MKVETQANMKQATKEMRNPGYLSSSISGQTKSWIAPVTAQIPNKTPVLISPYAKEVFQGCVPVNGATILKINHIEMNVNLRRGIFFICLVMIGFGVCSQSIVAWSGMLFLVFDVLFYLLD